MKKCNCPNPEPCEQRVTIDWIPNTACTLGVTMDGITDSLSLLPGIQACETKTHMAFEQGCIEYRNELFVATNGDEGFVERICSQDIAAWINLEDLANVEGSAPQPGDMLFYRGDANCGPNCKGAHDQWTHLRAPEVKSHLVFYPEDGEPKWEAM